MEVVIGIAALIVGYLFLNGRRNRNPLNRKCALEICRYLTEDGPVSVEGLRQIFLQNARCKSQANHVLSMVPPLLMDAGFRQEEAMSCVPLLRAAISELPH